jgi:protein-S-isoprenylcysteine O-methyltransferase Ste14
VISRTLSFTVSTARALYASAILSVADQNVLIAFAVIELLMASFSLVNVFLAKHVDSTWRGTVPMLVYLFGFLVQPSGAISPTLELMLWPVIYLRVWSLVTLGLCVTCGHSTYLSTVTSGPYAYIRHPMQLSGILARVVFVAAWPSDVNFFGLVMMAIGSILVVVAEESFLRDIADWKTYAAGVRYRLVPFIW